MVTQKAAMLRELRRDREKKHASKIPLKPFAVIILAVLILAPAAFLTRHISQWEYDYIVSGGVVTLTHYKGSDTEIEIPARILWFDVAAIGDGLFSTRRDITSIVIPPGITTIGDRAFEGCALLADIALPDSLTFIGSYAFQECKSLVSIVIPNGVTVISDGTFYNCTRLTNVAIPDSAITIGVYAFRGCTGLKSVTIPANVTHFGIGAFVGCSNLESAFFEGNAPHVYEISPPFSGCAPSFKVYYKEGTTGWSNPWFDHVAVVL